MSAGATLGSTSRLPGAHPRPSTYALHDLVQGTSPLCASESHLPNAETAAPRGIHEKVHVKG